MTTRQCRNCGAPLTSRDQKKYCSRECFYDHRSFAGENNNNFRGGKETTSCEICGGEFSYYPSEKKGVFCPSCVEEQQWQVPPAVEGPDNPRWKGGKVTETCVVCGATVTRYPSGFTSDVVTCSDDCRGEWLSEAFTGEGHPNYAGGGNEDYGPGWAEVRERALERDDHSCVHCGATREDLGRNPDVHHLTPVRHFVNSHGHELADAHTLDNVVSLCIPCHRRAEFGHLDPDALRDAVGNGGAG